MERGWSEDVFFRLGTPLLFVLVAAPCKSARCRPWKNMSFFCYHSICNSTEGCRFSRDLDPRSAEKGKDQRGKVELQLLHN
ncbi:hypothetical protein EYF80_028475 [Liparis tanakae]|uniref:Secreted protein n=1 Tax=Liparis tanakae TaxID=230148 RepID=A0A4Z2H925_9TELE|nr:hypothetical protein EYF80_028475 [Liparis tanakae]